MKTLFEITPLNRRATGEKVDRYIEKIRQVLAAIPKIDGLNVPEILDENHIGKPFYRNIDTRIFGTKIRKVCEKEVIVNKVVAHETDFPGWLKETKEKFGIQKLVLVGGTYEHFKYPGPSVLEANRMAAREGFFVGNISIPNRHNEEDRLLAKTKSGAHFFTTQVLYEEGAVKYLLRQYHDACKKEGMKPSTVYLSFAPVSETDDIDFLKFLGVVIPPHVEEALLKEQDLGEASLLHAQRLADSIFDFCEEQGITVPLGINVEQISSHNLDWASKMATHLGNAL